MSTFSVQLENFKSDRFEVPTSSENCLSESVYGSGVVKRCSMLAGNYD